MKATFSLLAGLALIIGITSGCAVPQANLDEISAGSTLKPVTIDSKPYSLKAMVPPDGYYARLRVYIEGDGHAWATSSTPSLDPTPSTSLTAHFAATDTRPTVYLARPCQFVMSAGCNQKLWTDERFNASVIEAYNNALNTLKIKYDTTEVELIGYSGGGAVALLLAAQRDDVVGVQTIAGNLDTEAWTRAKGLIPLEGSLNPADYTERLRNIPQRHIVGTQDTTVPFEVTQAYMAKLRGQCAEVISVDASHNEGFEQKWTTMRGTPYACSDKQGRPQALKLVATATAKAD
jgi:pimeloyl-ACP methyl ester carboxylesterase